MFKILAGRCSTDTTSTNTDTLSAFSYGNGRTEGRNKAGFTKSMAGIHDSEFLGKFLVMYSETFVEKVFIVFLSKE